MKIEVNQTFPETWGKLGVEEAKLAAERLSGEAFKSWVLLSLNQDGYIWCGDLEYRTRRELSDYGYLLPLDNGNFLFRPDGEPGDSDTRRMGKDRWSVRFQQPAGLELCTG